MDETSIDDSSVTKPLTFKRIPGQVSENRYNVLCSNHQLLCDLSKTCCVNLCLSTYGKSRLCETRKKYLSINGEEHDTFLLSRMQLRMDHNTGPNFTQVDYFLGLNTKCCRVAFKIAHSIGKMRLQRVQQ